MIYPMVPFPVTVIVTLNLDFKVTRGYHRCPRRIVCAADARYVCYSYRFLYILQ